MNYIALYALVLGVVWVLYVRRQRRIEREHAQQLQQSLEAGLAEPPSLHPVIDPLRCLGSSSCVAACPEDAIGIVDGKAVLVNAASCIGLVHRPRRLPRSLSGPPGPLRRRVPAVGALKLSLRGLAETPKGGRR